MSKIKKILLPVLAAIMCVMLSISAAMLIPKNTANAAVASNTAKDIGDLILSVSDDGSVLFDGDNLDALYKNLLGSLTTVTLDDFDKTDGAFYKAGNVFNASTLTSKAGMEYNVEFNKQKWIPAYLSKADGEGNQGHLILTLWLASSEDAQPWSAHSTLNDKYTNATIKYYSEMYSTSYIRAYLNPDARYSKAYNSEELLKYEYSPTSKNYDWHSWVNTFGEFCAAPVDMAWTRNLRWTATQNLVNEPTTKVSYSQSGDGASYVPAHANYLDWVKDALWIPAVSETGDSNSARLWALSNNQRNNSLGTWSRYSAYYVGKSAYLPNNSAHTHTASNDGTLAVRPAFNLDLTLAEESAVRPLKTPQPITVEYTGKKLTMASLYSAKVLGSWYNPKFYGGDNGVKDNLDDLDAIDAGTYTITFDVAGTDDGTGQEYVWKEGTGTTKKCTLKIEKKKLQVIITPQAAATVQTAYGYNGTPPGLPGVMFVSTDPTTIYPRDRDDGPNAANYPELAIRYDWQREGSVTTNGSTLVQTYDAPTVLGIYKGVAVLKNADAKGQNYQIDEQTSGTYKFESNEFEVVPRSIKVPSIDGNKAGSANISTQTYTGSPLKFGLNSEFSLDDITVVPSAEFSLEHDENFGQAGGTGTEYYLEATAAKTYTVTFQLKNALYTQWEGGGNGDKEAQFKINPVALKAGDSTHSTAFVDTGDNDTLNVHFVTTGNKGEWAHHTAVRFKILISGTLGNDKVVLKVYYKKDDGTAEGTINKASDYSDDNPVYVVPQIADKGNYKIYVELDDPDAYPVNKNYTLEQQVKPFEITVAIATFKPSDLNWQWSQGSGYNVFTEADSLGNPSVPYNTKGYEVFVVNSDSALAALGVKIDLNYNQNGYVNGYRNGATGSGNVGKWAQDAGTYSVWVWLVSADDQMYTYTGGPVEFVWTIEKATYDQSVFRWQYYIGTETTTLYDVPANGEIPFADAMIYIVLTTNYSTLSVTSPRQVGYGMQANGRNIASYTVTVNSFTNADSNYADPVEDPSVFPWSLNWKIVIATLPLEWEWETATDINGLTYMKPKISNYSTDIVELKYYEFSGFSTSGFDPENPQGTLVDPSTITVDPSDVKYYYAVAFIVDKNSNKSNYRIDYTSRNWYQLVTVGSDLQFIVLEFDPAEATYDGQPHAIASELKMSSPTGTIRGFTTADLTLKYYAYVGGNKGSALGNNGADAPVDAGWYYVEISITDPANEQLFLLATTSLTFEIKKATVDVSQIKWGYRIGSGELQEYIAGQTPLYFTAVNGAAQTYTLELMGVPAALAPYMTYSNNSESQANISHNASYVCSGYNANNFEQFTITANRNLNWSIEIRRLEKPDAKTTITFDNQDHDAMQKFCAVLENGDVDWRDYLSLTITYTPYGGSASSFPFSDGSSINFKHAGEYVLTFSIKVNSGSQLNVVWSDNDVEDYDVIAEIEKLVIEITHDMWGGKGSGAQPILPSGKTGYHTVITADTNNNPFNGVLADNATYRRLVVVKPEFEDDVEFTGQIYFEFKNLKTDTNTKYLNKPTLRDPEIMFDGQSHTITVADIDGFDSNFMEIVQNEIELPQNKVGEYLIVIRITGNACWDEGQYDIDRTENCYLTFKISAVVLELPTNVDDLTYTGSGQDAPLNFTLEQLNLVELTYKAKDGTVIDGKPVDVGEYVVVITIKSAFTEYVTWKTASVATQQLSFKINKATISPEWITKSGVKALETPSKFENLEAKYGDMFSYTFIDENGDKVDKSSLVEGKEYRVRATLNAPYDKNLQFEGGATQMTSTSFTFGGGSGGGGNSNGNGGGSGSFTEWLNANWWWLLIIAAVLLALFIVYIVFKNRREKRMLEMIMRSQQPVQPMYNFPEMPMGQQPVFIQLPQNANPQQLQLPSGIDEDALARAIAKALGENKSAPEVQVNTEYIHTGIDDDDGFYDDYTGYDDNNNNNL